MTNLINSSLKDLMKLYLKAIFKLGKGVILEGLNHSKHFEDKVELNSTLFLAIFTNKQKRSIFKLKINLSKRDRTYSKF